MLSITYTKQSNTRNMRKVGMMIPQAQHLRSSSRMGMSEPWSASPAKTSIIRKVIWRFLILAIRVQDMDGSKVSAHWVLRVCDPKISLHLP